MVQTQGKVRSVYAVVGRDTFQKGESLDSIISSLADELDTLGPTRIDGERAQLAEVLDEVRTMSLLSGRRVVIVDDADTFITANRKPLERYCGSPSDSGCLILMCNTLPKNTKLAKLIESEGRVIRCEAPRGRAIGSWIADRAKRIYQKRMSPGAAQRLHELLGDGLGVLDGELGKLSTYIGDRSEITPADVDALTGNHREDKVFSVTDAIANGDPETALHHWDQVLATDRSAPARAIGGLAWGVRRLLEARRAVEAGADVRQLASSMFTDPATLKRRLDRVTVAELEQQQRDLLAADLAVKTGASNVNTIVERFIVVHSARGQKHRAETAGSRR